MATQTSPELFPALPLESWEETKDTLHLFIQILGKIRLALMPRKNHWWYATLYVTTRGISTDSMPYQDRTLELHLDLVKHVLEISTSHGELREIPLKNGMSVSEFYNQVFRALRELNIQIKIQAKPYDVKSKIPFAEDHSNKHYDAEKVNLFWQVLNRIDPIFKEFSGRFYGKTSPVHLYWHHFDFTFYRFSGKKVPLNPESSEVEKDAYSHEIIAFGFWAGDEIVREATFFSYTYPLPPGIEKEPLIPASAKWTEYNGSPMAFLSYENFRKQPDPKKALLAFMESAYQAGAKLANWPVDEFKVPPLENL